jgi:hypothetical protein
LNLSDNAIRELAFGPYTYRHIELPFPRKFHQFSRPLITNIRSLIAAMLWMILSVANLYYIHHSRVTNQNTMKTHLVPCYLLFLTCLRVQQHGNNCYIVSVPELALIPLTFLICVCMEGSVITAVSARKRSQLGYVMTRSRREMTGQTDRQIDPIQEIHGSNTAVNQPDRGISSGS